MLEALPQIWEFLTGFWLDWWNVCVASSVLGGFLALLILDKMFGIFDIIKR